MLAKQEATDACDRVNSRTSFHSGMIGNIVSSMSFKNKAIHLAEKFKIMIEEIISPDVVALPKKAPNQALKLTE